MGKSVHRSEGFFTRLLRNLSSHSMPATYHHNIREDITEKSISRTSSSVYSTYSSNRQRSSLAIKLPSSLSSSNIVDDQLDSGNCDYKDSSSLVNRPLAVCGIKNHGNTCFMNAILQCLCYTDLLAKYFVMDYYKIDLIKHNQLNGRSKRTSRGEVTAQCATLFKSLWSNTYSPDISYKFKNCVARNCKKYEGNDQHDAQEFLLWLLDKFHEDLNIAPKRERKKSQKPIFWHRADELLAAQTLATHMKCDISFIRDLFLAQLRSSLVCQSCNNVSNTFDPYLCLSLPVATNVTYAIIVNVYYLESIPKQLRLAVSIDPQATIREMREKVSQSIKVSEQRLVLLKKEGEFDLTSLDDDKSPVHSVLENMEAIEAIETPLPEMETNTPTSPSSFEQKIVLVWSNRVGIGEDGKIFGPFFSCLINREASFKEIQFQIMKTMKPILRKTCDLGIIKDSSLFRLRVATGSSEKYFLPEDVDHPLFMPKVDQAISYNSGEGDYRGPPHLELIVEWDLDLRQTLLMDDDYIEDVIEDPSVAYITACNQAANQTTLKDCLDMYFREEKLAADNAWMCPACKRRQLCVKKLSLWSTPDIFIIHLKRFRQASTIKRTKLSTLVLFPLNNLDISPYLSIENARETGNEMISGNGNPFIMASCKEPCDRTISSQGSTYELYAVCNHHGTMQAGHYTAYCRNVVDEKWYSFDDQKVTSISEQSVVTADAYLLFYARKNLVPSKSNLSNKPAPDSNYTFSPNKCNSPAGRHWTSCILSKSQSLRRSRSSNGNLFNYHPHLDTPLMSSSSSSQPGNKVSKQSLTSNHPSRGSRQYSTLPIRRESSESKIKSTNILGKHVTTKNSSSNSLKASLLSPVKAILSSNMNKNERRHTKACHESSLEKTFSLQSSSYGEKNRFFTVTSV